MNKKIIVANYRYFVSGGPEVYMFKFLDYAKNYQFKCIPFSVKYSQNESTEYSKYFIQSRGGDSVYFNQIKKTPKSFFKVLSGAFFNKEAYKNITLLIEQEKPEVLYALQVINTLSPSIFKAAKKKGLITVHRISDFNILCPASTFLCNNEVCEKCIHKNFFNGIRYKCYHGSFLASLIRCCSMFYHRFVNIYKYVDYFVVPTNFTRNKFIEAGFDPDKVIHIPTFIDSSIIIPKYSHNNYFLLLGRPALEKGFVYAFKALACCKRNDFKLVVTCEYDQLDKASKEVIEKFNLTNRIVFTGFITGTDLEKALSNCIALLCPAIWYENMPNTVLEAYCYGKPVIASNIGCFSELVDDGTTGYLFEPKNQLDLASKMENILNQNVFFSMGKNARDKVVKEFNPENHFKKLNQLFEGGKK